MILLVRVPEQGKPPVTETLQLLSQRLDLLGCFAMFVPACVMILLGLSWGGQRLSWGSSTVIGLLCGGFGLSVVFGFWQRYKQDKALIPPSIFLQPVVFFGCLVSFLQGGAFLEMGYYMPLWFQSVRHASPLSSGLMLLPTMISQIIASMVSGYMIKHIAYTIPWALLGNVFIAVGAGLMITWRADTNEGTWIGYQIFVGAGRGLALQMPVISAQNYLTGMQIPIGAAMLMFMQYFGGAVFLSVAKTIFTNELISTLHKYAPDIDAYSIVHSGATSAFNGLSEHDRPLVVEAYNKALTSTFVSVPGLLAGINATGNMIL
ncbi:hypothetical protein NQ176_g1594 [Zarea fungicola]|uniref:Uncharacterized protein n=1 Tax=Zarea fungicola TaxID=93591 RepID=A0ACC1NUH5_9HYPO|nr:hypothetical protein NQ176_g1594 [Lecanicillium fungicola]